MASVCFYFQIHQPYRLRRYSVFDTRPDYFDDAANGAIIARVAERCYLPANRVILDLVRKYDGRFRVAYSLSGTVIEQLQRWIPEVIESFQQLAATGAVEFLSETHYHSLAFLYSQEEFQEQVALHRARIEALFGVRPRVFRNTELIYNNDVARVAQQLGFSAVLCEGADHTLGVRTPTYLYHPPGLAQMKLLLKDYRRSDDIAFRFSNRDWHDWPLMADKFALWLHNVNGSGDVINLFMDYETFGEHQRAETGIFEFLRWLPHELFRYPGDDFLTPSEVAARYPSHGEYDVPFMISWADSERDLSAWLGNAMQSNALHEVYRMEALVRASGDEALLADWRRLQTSDHFYYMCTKSFADGAVHQYFNPYDSPYDSYINYMNVLDNLRTRLPQPAARPARKGGKARTR
ncbi:MAG: polysaccharide deacetylase family protein [Phycisphaerales bacterium]|nr:polysaccharide deacetylase family protein [Phycisphaerales bacterium]